MLEFLDSASWYRAHRLTVPEDKHRPDYDGMAELWFEDWEALLAARQSPEWKASTEDEKNFIDHSKVAYFVSEERIISDEPKSKQVGVRGGTPEMA